MVIKIESKGSIYKMYKSRRNSSKLCTICLIPDKVLEKLNILENSRFRAGFPGTWKKTQLGFTIFLFQSLKKAFVHNQKNAIKLESI